MSPPPAIEFDSVGKCFQTGARGDVWAVRNFNLACGEGELTCLVGPSGCGKTTLLRLAMGLEQPTEGRVRLNRNGGGATNEHPGFVSQEGNLLPWRRVEDNVALGLELRGMSRKERLPIAHQALRRVGLPKNVARSYPHELSGGMRQRVVLARMACLHPRLLLMDEPFASLDEATRHRLQNDLLEFWRAERQTLLFVTHSLDEAVFLADRIVVMTFAGIAADRRVDWPRPRDRGSPAFTALAVELRSAL
jgi:NitT/TauT family transport system ATP-binding protein